MASGQGTAMMIEAVENGLPPDGGVADPPFVILGRTRREPACVKGAPNHALVILGRSKERSDAAQTLGSMPLPSRPATVRNIAPDLKKPSAVVACPADILKRLGFSANVTAWILGSAHAASRVLCPRMTKARSPSRVTQSVRQSGEGR
ncbi:MAG: hypothetical protein EOQ98_17195 [Mesorhizobium sp.]|uniref:Uncharacterized protein n=1 Tax=Mesorhizobium mediterraneum TaxID=43617 RepID=A0AB36RJH5_9HYPH|nr:hypothetical protein CIT25_01915 [Mesorhizobium mediterraneum]RUU27638.1 hypothetical protein EOC94_22505 [Mesorhizobium sp. M6A.T.Ce.TU.016.01.1.1]RVB73753.1 hypothetical protein EN885_25110 [Mesorhizobium sp. M6A.T.Cr.TU.014.01.1.1]RWN34730.1 MAG: hypothetical protein EOR96_27305 [Mesorhizobium sp.]RWN38834.1 MAG: hypothetical protein EOR95_00515 [Mesorhizobium sp.]